MKLSDEIKWIVPVILVCAAVFANSLYGEFVYDDMRQILRNSLIQDNSLIVKAMTSDVWAFLGDGTVAVSNYWRPTFTAWHILNYRLFGANPFGWHVTNLLLHLGVCVMAFLVIRRWQISAMIACAITLIFAIHPARVESVSWISGSPDLLFALAFLSSLWFAHNYAEKSKPVDLAISLLLYALAIGAKEIALLCLPIYYLVFFYGPDEENKKSKVSNNSLIGFGVIAVAYFFIRMAVIGAISRPPQHATTLGDAILTVPSIFAFYLRQMFFPVWMSANYPVQAISQIDAANFVLPLVISAAALGGIYFLARRYKYGLFAALLFFLPLAPAMNATTFLPDDIVHDRYLYLPMLGLLMLIIPFVAEFLKEKNTLILTAVLCLPLCFQTFTYNTAWASDLALWTWSSKVAKTGFANLQYGSVLNQKNRNDEAIEAYTASINAKPVARAYLGRGRSYLGKGRFNEAQKDLAQVLQMSPESLDNYTLYQTYEALGKAYSEQKKFDDAARTFTEARTKLPQYSAALSVNLAIVLYQKGDKPQALKELEGAREGARIEMLPESKSVFFRLGMIYTELKRNEEAKAAFREFLKLTERFTDETTTAERSNAAQALKALP